MAAQAAAGAGDQQQSVLPPELASYRPNVGICLLNKRGQVFAGQRARSSTKEWQMPQGGIDPGEAPLEAAMRELREETGVTSATLLRELPRWLTYDFPPHVRDKMAARGDGWQHYTGQAQRWFAFRFDGEDSDVDLQAEHVEFRAWRWAELSELPGCVVAFKRGVYDAVAAEFAPLAAQLREDAARA